MASAKITDLTAATNLDGSEQLPLVQGGTTKRVSLASAAAGVAVWQPNVTFRAGQLFTYAGQPWQANVDFTSGASFSSTNLTLVQPGTNISKSPLSTSYAMTSAWADITGPWQIVVLANSGPIAIEIPSILIAIATGTNAAGTSFNAQVRVVDELANVVAFNEYKIYSSAATSQTWAQGIPVVDELPNNVTDKTYHVQATMPNAGTASATATIFTAAQGFRDPILRARRT